MERANRIFVFAAVAVYTIAFILIGLSVFVANDESKPIEEILRWGVMIPVAIYSLFSLWVSFGLFLLLDMIFSKFISNKIVSKSISLPPSLIIGVPMGLIVLDKIVGWVTT